MSKRAKRLLSLLMALVMVMSLSTPAFALGGGRDIGIGSGFGRDIGDDDVREFDPSDYEAEGEDPVDYFQGLDEESGIQVTVESPFNAIPTKAEVRVQPVDPESVRETVYSDSENAPEVLVAVDISFWLDGQEIEPDRTVNVKISAPELEGRKDLQVIHIPDGEDAQPEDVEMIGEEDLSFALGTNEVAFKADSFSTYAVAGTGRTATIHYVYKDGNNFVELDKNKCTSTTYPAGTVNASDCYNYTSSGLKYLLYDFDGYYYKETRVTSASNGTLIYPILDARRQWSGLSYSYYWGYYSKSNNSATLANNANVYVIYEKKSIAQGGSSGGEGGTPSVEVPDLPAEKSVVPNGDGTYDITLSVTGVEAKQDIVTKANVIVIFDTSGSMAENMAGQTNSGSGNYVGSTGLYWSPASEQRMSIAKTAVKSLAGTLLSKTDKQGNQLVQMALIKFNGTASYAFEGFTSDQTQFNSAVDGLTASGTTNWEHALLLANSMVVPADSKTYVVFVSDGDPTVRISRLSLTDDEVYTLNGSNFNSDTGEVFGTGVYNEGHLTAAKREAESIVESGKDFYTIGLSSDATRMKELTTAAGSPETNYHPANDQDELNAAFDDIASSVEKGFGFTDVSINDGVTELTTVESDALTGTPTNFVYRKGTHTGDEIGLNEEWSDAPEATITDDNHVIWNTASIGALEEGVTYSVTFTVWPSQESYNIIADINNGIIRDASGNIVRKGRPDEAYDAQPDSVKAQIVIDGATGEYTLKTNTGVKVSYKFNGADGEKDASVTMEGSMALDTSYFAMHKDWDNAMDTRTASVLSKEDTDGKTYLLGSDDQWILDENGNQIELDWDNYDSWKDKAVFYVDLIVTKGDADYTEVRLTSEDLSASGGNPAWTWAQMFVAPGVLTHAKDANEGSFNPREAGDDYSVREKPSESYYWELFAEVYHPMVINGEACVLQKVTAEDEISGSGVKDAQNTFKGNYYNINGVVYKKLGSASDALISAKNERRSYLNLTKTVTGENAPADALFTYTVKMENPNGLYSGTTDDDFWFSVYDPVNKVTVLDENIVTGATREMKDGEPTGYWHFANVSGGTEVTIKIKAGWNVRFINLLSGTTYEITENLNVMEDGFAFQKVEAKALKNKTQQQTYTPTIDESRISGVIEEANTDYTVTYTNDFLGVFYVYHSNDNSVERLPIASKGKAIYDDAHLFNICDRIKDNTLYGGYYSDYAGKSDGFNAATLTYTNGVAQDATGAIPYSLKDEDKEATWDWTEAWDWNKGKNESGLGFIPETNAVYFLKEVPADMVDKSYLHVSYVEGSYKQIVNMWTVSNIDDANYSGVGFVILDGTEMTLLPADVKPITYGGTAAKSLKLTSKNDPTNVRTLTPKDQFNADYGFITYRKVMFWDTTANNYTSELKDNSIVGAYWITKDQVLVVGNSGRSYTGLTTTIDNVQLQDVSLGSRNVYDFTGMSVEHAYVDRNKG